MEKNRDQKNPTTTTIGDEEMATEKFLKPVLQKPPGYRELHAQPETPMGSSISSSSSTTLPRRPKHAFPGSFYPTKKKQRSRCRVFCYCFCITVAIVLLLLILAVSIFFLWYSPRLPIVRLVSFRVSDFTISGGGKANDGFSILTANVTARLDFKNPNGKLRYYYGDADVAVSVGDGDFETSLGSKKVKGFMEKPGNRTAVIVPIIVKKLKVDDPTGKMLRTEMKSKKLVVMVIVKTKVGLGVGRRKIATVGVSFRCGGVRLQTLDSKMAKCSIKMLKWIKLHS